MVAEENSQSCEQMVDPARRQQTNAGRGGFLSLVSRDRFKIGKRQIYPTVMPLGRLSRTSELALTQTCQQEEVAVRWCVGVRGGPGRGQGREGVRGRRPEGIDRKRS